VRGVLVAGPRHTERLSTVRLRQSSAHQPNAGYCVAGKVNRAVRRWLVIELVRPNAKHAQHSLVAVADEGAGGLAMGYRRGRTRSLASSGRAESVDAAVGRIRPILTCSSTSGAVVVVCPIDGNDPLVCRQNRENCGRIKRRAKIPVPAATYAPLALPYKPALWRTLEFRIAR
jgi:hypothetical protein